MEKKLNKWEPILSQMGIRKHIEKISLFCEEKNNRDDMSENKSHTLSLSLNLLSILDLENKKSGNWSYQKEAFSYIKHWSENCQFFFRTNFRNSII